jgi:hypothetical protein
LIKKYTLENGLYQIIDEGEGNPRYVQTQFSDGMMCDGVPSFTEEDYARAAALGYSPNTEGVWQMHQDHELAHSIVSEAMGFPVSPTLYNYNKFGKIGPGLFKMEESLAFLLQRAINIGREIYKERELT